MINVTDTIALLEEIIEAAGHNAVSARCMYRAPEGSPFYVEGEVTPQCIVGQIAFKVGGVEALSNLREWVNANEGHNAVVLGGLGFDQDSINFLQMLQVEQDKRKPWAEALDIVRPYFVKETV